MVKIYRLLIIDSESTITSEYPLWVAKWKRECENNYQLPETVVHLIKARHQDLYSNIIKIISNTGNSPGQRSYRREIVISSSQSKILVTCFSGTGKIMWARLRLGVTYEKSVTLGNVTMSHRTRERPAECLASLSHSTMIGLPRAH
ncbi:hypothetical protein EVAR_74570_1 [Eumeta japonica]|uniref:Uncharacterized protein n=1 Tax=Eumeta variegata TaxID=151549 RepID=A0A4C1TBP6_EUMVA|nr:hypothetical protein EVAR_74570_1 [Eumeta japonica]